MSFPSYSITRNVRFLDESLRCKRFYTRDDGNPVELFGEVEALEFRIVEPDSTGPFAAPRDNDFGALLQFPGPFNLGE